MMKTNILTLFLILGGKGSIFCHKYDIRERDKALEFWNILQKSKGASFMEDLSHFSFFIGLNSKLSTMDSGLG